MDKSNVQLIQELIPTTTKKYINLNSCKYCGIFTVCKFRFDSKRCRQSGLNKSHFNPYTCVTCKRSICIACKSYMHTMFFGKRKVCRECFMKK